MLKMRSRNTTTQLKMKTIIKTIIIFAIFGMSTTGFSQQLGIDAQYRPRAEFRNGFSKPLERGEKAAFFISHRARLGLNFQYKFIELKFSVQDVRLWGNSPQLADSYNNFAIQEIYAKLNLHKHWALKIGRQEITYDNERLFGKVDWTQQGRVHDAAIILFRNEKFGADVGFAFNQSSIKNATTFYDISGNYKTIQFAHLNYKFNEKMMASLLVLNNGMQSSNAAADSSKTKFSQTFGTFLQYKNDKVKCEGEFYYQTGKTPEWIDHSINAIEAGIDLTYKPVKQFSLTAGYQYLSGNKTASTKVNEAFTPFYGTNHKFNGALDYFYVGNHLNSVGLNDLHAGIQLNIKKTNLSLTAYHFNTAIGEGFKKGYLGNEVDAVFGCPIKENDVNLKVGYSHYFTSDRLLEVKGVQNPKNIQNWAWLMLDIKLHLFDFNKESK